MPLDDMTRLLENAEAYRRVVVQPLIDAMEAKLDATLKPIADQQMRQEQRIGSLESSVGGLQKKWNGALTGLFVWSTILSAAIGVIAAKVKKWFGA